MAEDTKYDIVYTESITVLNSGNTPVPGILIRFSFKPNHIGELRIPLSEHNADSTRQKILDYIKVIRELEGGSF
jgi:hypothetical protein